MNAWSFVLIFDCGSHLAFYYKFRNFSLAQSVPEPIKRLIEQCWVHDPQNRLTFTEIVNKLESPEFQLSSQNFDGNLFNEYVNRLKPHRPSVDMMNDPSKSTFTSIQ